MESIRISEVYMVNRDRMVRLACALLGKPDSMVDPESGFIVGFASDEGRTYTGYFSKAGIPSKGSILFFEKTRGIYNMEDAYGNRYMARVHEN